MTFHRRTKHYLILAPTETTLTLRALLHFRNKALARDIEPVDIDVLIKILSHKKSTGRPIRAARCLYMKIITITLCLPTVYR